MKKRVLTLVLAGMLAVSVTACGGSKNSGTEVSSKKEEVKEDSSESKEVTYQSILDEYSQKIKDATPAIVEEYNAEAAEKAGDVNALAELSNAKISKLAEISVEGTEKMAELKLKSSDDDATYTEWAGKLNDVYMEYSQQITDAYMNSATGQ